MDVCRLSIKYLEVVLFIVFILRLFFYAITREEESVQWDEGDFL